MTDEIEHKIRDIWAQDLFGRRAEAELIVAYLESVAVRPSSREDFRAFTLAVDVGYGEGKTFFLRRLARHIETRHPVAFVDAWADDTANEPLTALVATLERALAPLRGDPTVSERLSNVVEKVGGVAKAVVLGAVKRGAALAITESGVDAVLSATSGATAGARNAMAAAAAVGDDVVAAIEGTAPSKLMQERIRVFEETRAAIVDLKTSLTALLASLSGKALVAPIVIVIDELDRCRPSYAIKLLEEIKHLFDVPGLIFVFGMHGEQLAHAVGAAYGSEFDGKAYLQRFVSRRYRLRQPKLRPLVAQLLAETGLGGNKTLNQYFAVASQGFSPDRIDLDDFIARYLEMYRIPIRDAFRVVDTLQTCVAVSGGQALQLPYLLPLLISRMLDPDSNEMLPPRINPEWDFIYYNRQRQSEAVSPWTMAKTLHTLFKLPFREFNQLTYDDEINSIAIGMKSGTSGLGDPSRYEQLVEAVGRFDNPTS